MRKTVSLALAAAALLSVSLIAQADTIGAGTYGGTQVVTTGVQKDGSTGITYTESVYADPNNPLCADCYDFVIDISNPSSTNLGIDDVITKGFAGYTLDFAYDATNGGEAPDGVSTNKSGNTVTFDYSDQFLSDGDTASLIIYTDATDYTTDSLQIGSQGIDPKGYGPSGPVDPAPTPEPSSLILLGTGLFGIAGFIRRRRQA